MLSGFKKYAVWLYIYLALSPLAILAIFDIIIYLCMLSTEQLYFYAQIGAITRTAPFQTLLGVGYRPNSYNAKAVFGCLPAPLVIGETLDSLLGLQVLRPSESLQDLLRA